MKGSSESQFTAHHFQQVLPLVCIYRQLSSFGSYLVHLGPLVSVYATDNAVLKTLLERPGVIEWSSRIIYVCVDEGTLPTVVDVIENQKRDLDLDTYHLMTMTKDSLKLSPVPDGFKVTPLHPEQASLVNSLWKYNDGEHSEIYIRDIVTKLPSCCLYNKEGHVIGFALKYHYGAVGMLHVLEEQRGKGYAKVIMSHLAQSCFEKNREIFILPEEDNKVSVNLHQDIGFRKVAESKRYAIVVDV